MQNNCAESLVSRYFHYQAETKRPPAEICFGNMEQATQKPPYILNKNPQEVAGIDKKLEAVINLVKYCQT